MESSYLPAYIVQGVGLIIWLLPPLKQYKGKYFNFFLILAIEDPITIFLIHSFKIYPTQVYSIMYFILFLSLIRLNKIKRFWYLFLIMISFIFITNFYLNYKEIIFFIIISGLLIVFIFLKLLAENYNKNNRLNSGYLVLILYNISILLKFYLAFGSTKNFVAFFYFTTAFEILVAIFFTIYKVEESPAIKLNFFTANK